MLSTKQLAGLRIHVHTEGTEQSALRRLMAEASAVRPLSARLSAMCRETAAVACVDVVSSYAVERDGDTDMLVMRGNHGFPAEAVGSVRLALGEGITGIVAECLRPVSVAVGPEHEQFCYVPGIGEETFPSFLGVPISVGERAVGVLVLQRRGRAGFTQREVTLAMALSAPFAAALEPPAGTPDVPAAKAKLRGKHVVPGAAVGWARRAPELTDLVATKRGRTTSRSTSDQLLDRVAGDLALLRLMFSRRAMRPPVALQRATSMLAAPGFRNFVRERVDADGLVLGLKRVASEHRARFGAGATGDMAELCAVIGARAAPGEISGAGTILVGYRLGWPLAMVAALEGCSATIVESGTTPAARAIMRAARIPLVECVGGLWTWTEHGDLVLLGDDASIQIKPATSALASFFHACRPRPSEHMGRERRTRGASGGNRR